MGPGGSPRRSMRPAGQSLRISPERRAVVRSGPCVNQQRRHRHQHADRDDLQCPSLKPCRQPAGPRLEQAKAAVADNPRMVVRRKSVDREPFQTLSMRRPTPIDIVSATERAAMSSRRSRRVWRPPPVRTCLRIPACVPRPISLATKCGSTRTNSALGSVRHVPVTASCWRRPPQAHSCISCRPS